MVNNNLRTLETLFTESIGDNNLKKIIIPKIQRSYAQGRKEEVQVREGILQELFSTLKEGKDIELNASLLYSCYTFIFIYKKMVHYPLGSKIVYLTKHVILLVIL